LNKQTDTNQSAAGSRVFTVGYAAVNSNDCLHAKND